MPRQNVDNILFESPIPTTSLESLVQGYILNYKTEGKSPKTISFLRAGGDVSSLQYLLGHSTLQMTQRYLQSLNANDAANAHKKFSPLDNLGKVKNHSQQRIPA